MRRANQGVAGPDRASAGPSRRDRWANTVHIVCWAHQTTLLVRRLGTARHTARIRERPPKSPIKLAPHAAYRKAIYSSCCAGRLIAGDRRRTSSLLTTLDAWARRTGLSLCVVRCYVTARRISGRCCMPDSGGYVCTRHGRLSTTHYCPASCGTLECHSGSPTPRNVK